MSESGLSSAVCSITPTHRRRFFWAAWWTTTPQYGPFQKPDASNGGARSLEEALQDAERVAGRHLTVIEPHWARAWNRVLRGEVPLPPPPPEQRAQRAAANSMREPALSAWAVLGLPSGASHAEIKRAFRRRALETHPARGGEAAQFRRVQRAYEKLTSANVRTTKKRA
ncbi:MAG: dnaJ [Myxococcaceae bacterium]|nr:dnaJ [Myxococcaceae bacterium]